MQLDGPDLEQLLVRAREEYGSDVRIVKADKVRSGGVGGFFARERYELSIEVDEQRGFAPPDRKPLDIETSAGRPVSLLDLADAISDREIDALQPHQHQRQEEPRSQAPVAFTPGISPGPALSTDGESFASILAGLTETVAGDPKPAATLAQRPAAQPAVVLDTEAVVATRPSLAEPSVRRRAETRPRTATRRTDTRTGTETRPARRPRGVVAVPSAPPSLRDLRELGLPRELLPSREDGDLLATLVSALRSLPPTPQLPQRPGDIVAVVGDGDGAWDAAVALARSIDLDERALVYLTAGSAPTKVAPARRITALDQLPARIDRWRKRTTPTVAVVDAPMTMKAAGWNRRALDALDAQAVWLVVPATRKTEDVARWAARLGRGDGLVVTDVDASSDPASVLNLGVPVGWLDGRPATPGSWAGLLVDRLVESR
jgi:hypothetical protein